MARLNFKGYKELLKGVYYWKLRLLVQFKDVEFKFKNTGLGNNGASKLTIYGIVPEVPSITVQTRQGGTKTYPTAPSREYVIYTELKGINLERWNVRIPYVVDWKGWNIFSTPETPAIIEGYKLEAGIGYDDSTEKEGPFYLENQVRMFNGWSFTTSNVVGIKQVAFSFSGNEPTYTVTTKRSLRFAIRILYETYKEHPCIVFYSNSSTNDLSNKKFYNVLPIGIEKYKVKLELANGESVYRFFDPLWNPI